MDRITISFPQLLPDGLQHTDDIADGTILIPDSHIHNTSIIRNAVKSRMYFNSAFSKFLADVPWERLRMLRHCQDLLLLQHQIHIVSLFYVHLRNL